MINRSDVGAGNTRNEQKGDELSTHEEFASHIRNSLCQNVGKKQINPKFFYDKRGSNLFELICIQPEYYLTRTEVEILKSHSMDIVSGIKCAEASMIEFGSGSSLKSRIILEEFLLQHVNILYFPIDISYAALTSGVRKLSSEFMNLDIIGVSCEYLEGIRKICNLVDANAGIPQKKIVFFLGSSIGNFEPDAAKSFLKSIKRSLRTDTKDKLFVSFDLEKDPRTLESAYNDKAGMTAKFNLNLLKRINNHLGGMFNTRNFSHSAIYNEKKRRIEMTIVSKLDQEIYIRDLDQTIRFKKNERIHTENSYKYSLHGIKQLAEESGFIMERNYTDTNMWISLTSLSKG